MERAQEELEANRLLQATQTFWVNDDDVPADLRDVYFLRHKLTLTCDPMSIQSREIRVSDALQLLAKFLSLSPDEEGSLLRLGTSTWLRYREVRLWEGAEVQRIQPLMRTDTEEFLRVQAETDSEVERRDFDASREILSFLDRAGVRFAVVRILVQQTLLELADQ